MLTDKVTSSIFVRALEDHLVLRQATAADAEAVATFNSRIHRDPGVSEPDGRIAAWTRDLLSNTHPTVRAGDTLVVEDTRTGQIVSTTDLISQTWTYDGIEFGVGRPELVGTLPDYRRRGLIRAQFEVLHQWSAARGELAQGITGIPWYYRQFGYEMGLALGGGRTGFRPHVPLLEAGQAEPYQVRPAGEADLPFMAEVYAQAARRSLIGCVRPAALWRYELSGRSEASIHRRVLCVIQTPAGEPVGYLTHIPRLVSSAVMVLAYELKPGVSWLAVTPSVIRYLVATGDGYAAQASPAGSQRCEAFGFGLGVAHPVYEAVPDRLPRVREPYAWYVRVPDLPRFIQKITPVLERRLADSVAVGHTGELRLSFYRDGLRLKFEAGRLTEAAPWQPSPEAQGDAAFPEVTFLQLVFGYRALGELKYAFKDCWTEHDEAHVVLSTLFPKRPSFFWEIA